MAQNKLGLTTTERTVFYQKGDSKLAGEIRQYDPVSGFMSLHDPFKNRVVEFIWDQSTSSWKGTGVISGYVANVTITDEAPIDKSNASDESDKAVSVSRFPS
jgi:hypothetical protein|tara:strand:+ start:290 stop:595 length:306 start_codon:yes stop_codon:yes gene_type:complete